MSKKRAASAIVAGLVVTATAFLVARCVAERQTVKIAPAPAASIAKLVSTETVAISDNSPAAAVKPAPKAKAKKKARKAKRTKRQPARAGFFAK